MARQIRPEDLPLLIALFEHLVCSLGGNELGLGSVLL
jgi:hypothetical protein